MSKKTNVRKTQVNETKHYKMPTETWWGKLLIWLLFFGMVGGVILSFIVALINGQA
jgi:hypothetical protein